MSCPHFSICLCITPAFCTFPRFLCSRVLFDALGFLHRVRGDLFGPIFGIMQLQFPTLNRGDVKKSNYFIYQHGTICGNQNGDFGDY
jgi:hypothetical protein